MIRYHFDNQEKKSRASRKKLVIAAVIMIGFVACILLASAVIQNLAAGPAWLGQKMSLGTQSVVNALTPKSVILADNARLREEVRKYEGQALKLQILEDDNTKLRQELSYQPTAHAVITARVLAKPNQSLYNSLIIDQGSSDGVQVGQIVSAEGVIGLGKVSRVASSTATVELFSGPQFKDDLALKNQSITVTAVGKGGGNFEIHIPREIKIADGDILTLPSMPDLAIGVVKSIIFDPRDPFQTVLARVPVNIQELSFVEVVK